jgi:hypothetical protein
MNEKQKNFEKNHKRIEDGDFSLGLGLVVTDIIVKEMETEDKHIILTEIEEGKTAEYEGKLEELRIICKNEKFILATAQAYFPYEDRDKGIYNNLDYDEIVLVKEININEDAPGKEDSYAIGKTLQQLRDYLQVTIEGLYFFFYFPENVIVSNEGKALVSVRYQTGWEHQEEFGEHE